MHEYFDSFDAEDRKLEVHNMILHIASPRVFCSKYKTYMPFWFCQRPHNVLECFSPSSLYMSNNNGVILSNGMVLHHKKIQILIYQVILKILMDVSSSVVEENILRGLQVD